MLRDYSKKACNKATQQCQWEFMFIITLLRASLYIYYIMFCLSFIFSLEILQSCRSVLICIQVVISLFLECQSSLPAPSSGFLLYSFLHAPWIVHIGTFTNPCPQSPVLVKEVLCRFWAQSLQLLVAWCCRHFKIDKIASQLGVCQPNSTGRKSYCRPKS